MGNCQAALSRTRVTIVEAFSHFQSSLDVAEIIFQYVSYDILLRIYQVMGLKFLYSLRNFAFSILSSDTTRVVKEQLHSFDVSYDCVVGL